MQGKITNQLAANKLFSDLTSGSSTLVLARLAELDEKLPSKTEAAILKKAFDEEKNEVLKFQMKKSLRFVAGKFKNIKFKVEVEGFKALLTNPDRLEDTALALLALTAGTAFIVADIIRESSWQNMKPEILPSFCQFFKAYGGVEDVQTLLELTRHSNAVVLTSAINALEAIDPTNLQGVVEPLLTSSTLDTKAQAIQVLYKWNRTEAIKYFRGLLLSENKAEKALALHHGQHLDYKDIENHLLELLSTEKDPSLLLSLSRIFMKNAHIELPSLLHNTVYSLSGEQQNLTKGLLLGVIRELGKRNLIEGSVQDYLKKLKQESIAKSHAAKPQASAQPQAPAQQKPQPQSQLYGQVQAQAQVQPQVQDEPQSQAQKQSPAQLQGQPSAKAQLPPQPEQAAQLPVVQPEAAAPLPQEDLKEKLKNYKFLSEKEKIQFMQKITPEFFVANRSTLLSHMTLAVDKELAAHIKLIGRYGDVEDATQIKALCKSSNADVVCACIRALTTLDVEFLCLYLPQFLQEKNGKIRMTATRVFAQIDSVRMLSLLTGMISSPNSRLRNLGVSTSMLVDFNLVREPLIQALAKEKSLELLEKISTVLASNPDKEMLLDVYKIMKQRIYEQKEMQIVLKNIAEKLSITINKEQSPEEILLEIEELYKKEKTKLKEKRIKDLKTETQESKEIVKRTTSEEDKTNVRRKVTFTIMILAGAAWGGLVAYLLLLALGG